jgi:hypothetical protein
MELIYSEGFVKDYFWDIDFEPEQNTIASAQTRIRAEKRRLFIAVVLQPEQEYF